MDVLTDINVSFQNCLVGLSTIIFCRLARPTSFDSIFEDLGKVYLELNVPTSFSREDVFDALLLLYSLGKIRLDDKGEVVKL